MSPPLVLPTFSTPQSSAGAARRIAVIGGGISGLAAAHRLFDLDPAAQVTLFEAGNRLGGVLHTDTSREGWLIERSADMFTTREPWALDLCRRIGIADELIETDARYRRAFVVCRGQLVPVPEGFTLMSPAKVWPIFKTPLLSPLGKLRLASECFIPKKTDAADESLQSFVTRRFGREAFDRLIQPLIGGIYTADPTKLSMQATLPQFVELERKYGSLIKGVRGQRSEVRGQGKASGGREPPEESASHSTGSGARYGQFLAPRGGMQRLVDALAARLPAGAVRLNAPVEHLAGPDRRAGTGLEWIVSIRGRSEPERFEAVVLSTPGATSSRLLESVDGDLASAIGRIPHAGCSVAILGVRRDQITHPLDGFGFVVPTIENRRIIAGSMASVKFPGRAPEGKVLLRVFVGGALQPELGELSETEIRKLVIEELQALIGLIGEPEFFEVARWLGMMPQYHVGHLELVRQIEERAAAIPGFALAGNAYRGVGVPFCIHSGQQAAERVLVGQASRLP